MRKIEFHPSVESYFFDAMKQALSETKLSLTDTTNAYVISLFKEMTRTEALHRCVREDETGTPTLTWLYQRALQVDSGRRFEAFRHLGDVALIVAGLFREHLQRRKALVGLDYHVRMGSGAYANAANIAKATGFAAVFSELSQKFFELVHALDKVAQKSNITSKDRSSLYTLTLN